MKPRSVLLAIFSLILIDWLITRANFSQELNPLLYSEEVLDMTKISFLSIIGLAIAMPPRENRVTTKILAAVMTVMFLAVASNIVIASGTDTWIEYQDDYTSRGFVHDESSHFTGVGTQYAQGIGSNYQPLASSLYNGSTSMYFVAMSGNYLQLRNSHNGLVDEFNIGGAATCQPTITEDWDGNGLQEIHVAGNSNITIIEYNGTNMIKKGTFAIHSAFASVCSGIRCVKASVAPTTGKMCFLGTGTKIWRYDPVNSSRNGNMSIAGMNIVAGIPAADDIDRDGSIELAVRDDANANGAVGFRIIKATTSVCVVDDLSNSIRIANPTIRNIDEAGNSEVLLSYNNGGAARVAAYKADCTASIAAITYASVGGDSMMSPIVSAYVGNSPDYIFCTYSTVSTFTNAIEIACYNNDGTPYNVSLVSGVENNDVASAAGSLSLVAADTDGDGLDELLTPGGIFRFDPTVTKAGSVALDFAMNYSFKGKISYADMDGDEEAEILYMNGTRAIILYSDYDNVPPVIRSRTYGQNYASPVCIGTTLTLTATQCGAEPCHYTNTESGDTERLVSTCGNNATIQNGTFSLTAPSLSCYYGQAGAYSFPVYLQDNSNTDDFTQYKTVTIAIVNGTPGFTCNLPPSAETITGANVTTVSVDDAYTSEEDIQYVVDTITGQSPFIEAFMVVIFTAIAIFGMFKAGVRQTGIFALGIFALWMAFALLGILSWVYVVIYALVAALVAAAGFSMGGR